MAKSEKWLMPKLSGRVSTRSAAASVKRKMVARLPAYYDPTEEARLRVRTGLKGPAGPPKSGRKATTKRKK
jgi:hypothetical protein